MAMKITLHPRSPKERNQMELQMLSSRIRKTWEHLPRFSQIFDLHPVYLDHQPAAEVL
jgi:hypothetical protein